MSRIYPAIVNCWHSEGQQLESVASKMLDLLKYPYSLFAINGIELIRSDLKRSRTYSNAISSINLLWFAIIKIQLIQLTVYTKLFTALWYCSLHIWSNWYNLNLTNPYKDLASLSFIKCIGLELKWDSHDCVIDKNNRFLGFLIFVTLRLSANINFIRSRLSIISLKATLKKSVLVHSKYLSIFKHFIWSSLIYLKVNKITK